MTPFVLLIALVAMRSVTAVVELDCSDNATCVEHVTKDLIKNLRQQKAVKIFDLMTIEPLGRRQGRASRGLLTKFLEGHAFSFDWNDFTFRISQPRDGSDNLELEVYESRTAKDVTDATTKKSSSESEEESGEDRINKIQKLGLKRKQKKKVMQVLLPLLFGMKSAGAVIFAFTLVAILTIKAFVASKMALLVSLGMAMKKFYDSYGGGVGLQTQPYLYSQYPIDFPSATSHAYSVSGVSPQFASPEMYNPTAMGTHTHPHDILSNDASAQQSQQAPTLQLINSTRAAERWDGYRRRPMYYGPSRATSDTYSGFQRRH